MELLPSTYYHTRDKRIAYVLGRLPLTGYLEHGWIVAFYKHGNYSLFSHSYRGNGSCNLDQSEAPEDLVSLVSAQELEDFYGGEVKAYGEWS